MEFYQIKKRAHTHTAQKEKKKKKNDGQIKKTVKRVTDSTLRCYGAMVGKHNSVWPFKVNPSRNSAHTTVKLTENRSKKMNY